MNPDIDGLVVDFGSWMSKSGFSGDSEPRVVFPTVINRRKYCGIESKDYFIGDEVGGIMRSKYEHTFPIPPDRSPVEKLGIEQLCNHTFHNELRVSPEEFTVIATSFRFMNNREFDLLCQIIFEKNMCPSYCLIDSSVASLYSSGRETGAVLESGHGITQVTPIFEGLPIHHSKLVMDDVSSNNRLFSGSTITDSLVELLRKTEIFEIKHTYDLEIVRDIKEKFFSFVLDEKKIQQAKVDFSSPLSKMDDNYLKEKLLSQEDDENRVTYELPDGGIIYLPQDILSLIPESFFRPSLANFETLGVHKILDLSIRSCDRDLHPFLFKNIVLCGGSTMIKNFKERLLLEIQSIRNDPTDIKIVAPPERKYSAWIGASMMSSLSTYKDVPVTKSEYEEYGYRILETKCPFVTRDNSGKFGIFEALCYNTHNNQELLKDRNERIICALEYFSPTSSEDCSFSIALKKYQKLRFGSKLILYL